MELFNKLTPDLVVLILGERRCAMVKVKQILMYVALAIVTLAPAVLGCTCYIPVVPAP